MRRFSLTATGTPTVYTVTQGHWWKRFKATSQSAARHLRRQLRRLGLRRRHSRAHPRRRVLLLRGGRHRRRLGGRRGRGDGCCALWVDGKPARQRHPWLPRLAEARLHRLLQQAGLGGCRPGRQGSDVAICNEQVHVQPWPPIDMHQQNQPAY